MFAKSRASNLSTLTGNPLSKEVTSLTVGLTPIDFRGVGNNPDPIPFMSGTNVGSWYAMPLCIIPERGQVSENCAHPISKQR